MADEFRVGDVVVCIDDSICPVRGGKTDYRKGRIYRVAHVKTGLDDFGRSATGLKAFGVEHEAYRNVICFKKLPPADEAFTRQMRACRPAKVGEMA